MNVKAFVPLFFPLAACSSTIGSDIPSGECPYSNTVTNPNGKLHGEPCTDNAECTYGLCLHSDAYSADPNVKFCTKQCQCGANSACGDDKGNDGEFFTCQRFTKSKHPTETVLSFCSLACTNVGDCPVPFDDCSSVADAAPSKVCRQKSATASQ